MAALPLQEVTALQSTVAELQQAQEAAQAQAQKLRQALAEKDDQVIRLGEALGMHHTFQVTRLHNWCRPKNV